MVHYTYEHTYVYYTHSHHLFHTMHGTSDILGGQKLCCSSSHIPCIQLIAQLLTYLKNIS